MGTHLLHCWSPSNCRTALAAAALGAVLLSGSVASAQKAFEGLGDLPGGIYESLAQGVNADGSVVVGISRSGNGVEAFRWVENGTPRMVGLGDLPGRTFRSQAWAVSAHGFVVTGQSDGSNNSKAYRWTTGSGVMAEIGGLGPHVDAASCGFGVSGDGATVVGWSNNPFDPTLKAFSYDPVGGIVDLGNLPGGQDPDVAFGASGDGSVIVGYGTRADGNTEAFRWTAATGMVGLGDLPGGPFYSEAKAVSVDGTIVVGVSEGADGRQAFMWKASTGMVSLSGTPAGHVFTEAVSVSADGSIVVGDGYDAGDSGAYVWTAATGAVSVRSMLIANGAEIPAGWNLYSGTGVSAEGCTIIGRGNGPHGTEGWIARLDRDGDGLLDCWEREHGGIDGDNDGLPDLNLWLLGAREDMKDIFVEVDAMMDRAPVGGVLGFPTVLAAVEGAFRDSPVTNPPRPDGSIPTGIRLHAMLDDIDLEIGAFPGGFARFNTLKTEWFGTSEQRPPNVTAGESVKILAAKRKAFRYCIFADTLGPGTTSGLAEFGGNDFFVTLGGWRTPGGTPEQQAGTFMHELGHTLGLRHGGDQSDPDPAKDHRYNYKPNYYSVMNYTWQTSKGYAGWRLDYSSDLLNPLDEANLNEPAGLAIASAVDVQIGPPPATTLARQPGGPGVDWDGLGGFLGIGLMVDINYIRPDANGDGAVNLADASPGDTLLGHNDWANLDYNFRDSADFNDGVNSDTTADAEIDQETDDFLWSLGAPACPADFDVNGVLEVPDIFAFLTAWFANDPAAFEFGGAPGVPAIFAFLTAWFVGC